MLQEGEKKSMWSNHWLLGLTGLTSGLAVSAGTFALVVTLRIMPRIIGMSNTADQVIRYENMIIAGGIFGNIVTVFTDLRIPLGSPFLILYGLCCGIQVGCLVMALAEIMDVFPIMFRRMNLKTGMAWVITAMAAGKAAGGIYYFYHRMGSS